MPKAQHLYLRRRFIEMVHDIVFSMEQGAHVRPVSHSNSQARLVAEGFQPEQNGTTELFGRDRIIASDVGNDLFEVSFRPPR
jgi:hypothetical protein